MINLARQIAGRHAFQNFILIVIFLTAAIIGLETSATLTARYGPVFDGIEVLVQTIFILEIAIRLLAYWPRPLRFFADGWNVFDLAVVTASLLPQAGP
ncbi:MAG: ion transporter, partial [Chloroflexi bacterium]|nr:ion transporter [Chloroflexota bacterium]